MKLAAPSGRTKYARLLGGAGQEHLAAVAIDKKTRTVVVGGCFEQTVDFGVGPHTSRGTSDAIVMSLGTLP